MRLNLLILAGVVLSISACNSTNDGTGIGGTAVSSVTITGASGSFASGSSVQLTASAFDAGGARIAKPGTFVWSSTAPGVATVDQAGKVSTLSTGTTSITASVGGIAGSTSLTVGAQAVSTKDTVFTLPVAFTPNLVTITSGASVTFIFGGSVEHNAIFRASNPPGSPPDIQNATNRTFTRTFTSKGTFNYDCTVHPGMTGQVVVQ